MGNGGKTAAREAPAGQETTQGIPPVQHQYSDLPIF